MFALGLITGLLIASVIITTMAFFRKVIEQKIGLVEKAIENAGPRPKGFIVEPTSEADDARQKIIDKNRAQGKDTPLEDLL